MNIGNKLFIIGIILFSFRCFAQTASVSEGCAPLEVKFTAPDGMSSYFWDFKDGVTVNTKDPSNTFIKAGNYEVTLREGVGGPVKGTVSIKVYKEPELNIEVSPFPGCAPLDAKFKNVSDIDPSLKINNYVWVFGDGRRQQGVENPSHLYPSVGKYNVSFSIETDHATCNKTKIFNNAVEVIRAPSVNFTTTPPVTSSCENSLEINFRNQTTGDLPLTYEWDLGNGVKTTSQDAPAQTYTKGQYLASLTASYTGVPGCSLSTVRGISVGAPEPEIIMEDYSCIHLGSNFNTNTPGTYSWNFGKNASMETSTLKEGMVVFDAKGWQEISLTVTSLDGRCKGTTSKQIYVEQIDVSIVSTPTFGCSDPLEVEYKFITDQEDLKFAWVFLSDSLVDSVNTVVRRSYRSPDTLYYSTNRLHTFETDLWVLSPETGCLDIKSTLDSLWLPNARYMPDKFMGCAPLEVTFSDSSSSFKKIVKWEWFFGDGNKQVTTEKTIRPRHVYTTPGEYLPTLVITNENGCTDTSYAVLIEVGEDLRSQIDFEASRGEVCPGENILLSVTKAPDVVDGYHFSAGDNFISHCYHDSIVDWSFKAVAGSQPVSLTVDYNGCLSTITKDDLVNVKGAIAKVDYEMFCSEPMKYRLMSKSQNAAKLTWKIGSNPLIEDGEEDFWVGFEQTGNIRVVLTASDESSGCASTTDEVILRVRNVKASIKVDSLICINSAYTFDASASKDVHGSCYTGYTWQFPTMDKRPLTTDKARFDFSIPVAGDHEVRLITKDINGCKDTATAKFKVYDMLVNATKDKELICTPNAIQFTDISTGDTTLQRWVWTINQDTISTERHPLHSFDTRLTSVSNIPVVLEVTDALGCKESKTINIPHYQPTSAITVSKSQICLGDTITVSASDYTDGGSNLQYIWDFGNGVSSAEQSNIVLYDTARVHTIKLDFSEVATGCKGSTSAVVQIQSYPKASFETNVDSSIALCAPQNVFFKDITESQFLYTNFFNFGNGQSTFAREFSLFYDRGSYEVMQIARTSFGCADTLKRTFDVYKPEGNMTLSRNTICKGEEIGFEVKNLVDVSNFSLTFGDGDKLDGTEPVTLSHVYNFHPPSGRTFARLALYGFGCNLVLEDTVNIYQVVADFLREGDVDTSICFNDGPYHFTNISQMADEFLWELGDGSTSSQLNPVHQYATSGVYDVRLSVSNRQTGCRDTIVKQVVVYDNPVVVAIGDTVCQGDRLFLKVTHPNIHSSYVWTPALHLSDATVTAPTSDARTTINYTVVETDTNNCTGRAFVPAIVVEPIDFRNWDTTIVIGDEIALPVERKDMYIFNWAPSDGLSCLNCSYPRVRPLEDIVYTLLVTDSLGCFTSPFELRVDVKPETFVRMPTTFTPNGDGANDVIYVRGWGIKELLEFQVFNRWGQMIYSSNNMDEGWDGTFKGVVQNSDVYVYKVKVKTWKDEIVFNEGYINLVH